MPKRIPASRGRPEQIQLDLKNNPADRGPAAPRLILRTFRDPVVRILVQFVPGPSFPIDGGPGTIDPNEPARVTKFVQRAQMERDLAVNRPNWPRLVEKYAGWPDGWVKSVDYINLADG